VRLARLPLLIWILVSACADRPAPEALAPRPLPAAKDAAPPAPGPPKRLITHRYVVNVRTAPNRDAFRLGYLRAGSVFTATTNHPIGQDKCRKGWYQLAETGGFVCSGYDVIAFEGKRLPERRARQPDLTALLPYPYAFTVRNNAPLYRRLPSDEEAVQYEGYRIPGTEKASPVAEDAGPAAAPISATDSPQLTAPTEAAPLVPASAESQAGASASNLEAQPAEEDGPPTLASLKGELDSVLERRLVKGFYVSLDRDMRKAARRYWRTQANGFIPYHSVREVEGSAFHGAELSRTPAGDAGSPGPRLPIGFVMSSKAFAYPLAKNGKPKRGKAPGYHFRFTIVDHVEVGQVAYDVAEDGTYYRSQDITRIDARTPPSEIQPDEKWIDVDLAKQTLVAYEGSVPVFATLVSTGRVRDQQDPLQNFATPTGSFRILSKHLTHTMDGDHAVDGPYSIEDVPYVMYFQLAYAIHSAFWHDSFGRTRSHGCINASPADARFLFQWVTPELPKHWHAVYPSEDRPSTRLYIRGEAP
jgi:lipoprotein-anchoring transpeptidase ErfK/SrfK